MAKLTIEQPHGLSIEEVKRRLTALSDRLASKYGLDTRWVSECEAQIKATGVTARLSCSDGVVRVLMDLSFALLPIKGKIEERLRRELRETLCG
jgi:putative polyhydroxyalkanoate system protein